MLVCDENGASYKSAFSSFGKFSLEFAVCDENVAPYKAASVLAHLTIVQS